MPWGAPPTDHFRLVWDRLRAGAHLAAGIEGVGKYKKCNKIAWCLYETLRRSDANFLLDTAQTIWLARDARKQRLLIRFRAVGFKGGEIVSRVGVLGQYKDFSTDATGIAEATTAIVKASVTDGMDKPAGIKELPHARSASQTNAHCALDRAKTILDKVEALTVDAAADEVLAGDIMRGRSNMENDVVTCPNLKIVVRDKTHASRRTTQKPETCDVFLAELVDKLFKGKHSITQLIHHSHVWSAHFASYVQDVEGRVGQGIKNVKGAKHRHESAAKPRGRFVLYMDAYIQTAMHMLHGRHDEVGKHASEFLAYLNEEVALQAAMLADATDEGLLFTRALDNEDTDPAELQVLVEDFLTTLQSLFEDQECINVEGTYTHFMMSSLAGRPRVFATTRNGQEIRLGGRPIPVEIVNRCLNRMVRFVKLATAVTCAEFPNFDLFCAFQVFNLQTRELVLTNPRAARRHYARSASDDTMVTRHNLQTLARFFGVNADVLSCQYNQLRVCAQTTRTSTDCDNVAAWREAVRRHSSGHATLNDKHPFYCIIYVVMRYVCFSMSTAAVEQSFQVFKRTFGEQGLGGSNSFENRMVKLILARHISPELDTQVVAAAQELYIEYGGVTKSSYVKRRDAGSVRNTANNNSESMWLKRRRAAVRAVASKRPRTRLVAAVDALDEDEEDTEAMAILRHKQKEKYKRAKIEAYRDGIIPEDQDLKSLAEKDMQDKHRRGNHRQRMKTRVEAVTSDKCVDLPEGPVYVDPAVDTPELQAQLRAAGRTRADRDKSLILIVEDVASPGRRNHWCAVLNGGYLVTSRCFASGEHRGPIIAFKAASNTRRVVHMTDSFKTKHPEVVRLIESVGGWKMIPTIEEYLEKYRRTSNKSTMALLKRKAEVFPVRKHVYEESEFLQFIRNVVRDQSKMGVCKR